MDFADQPTRMAHESDLDRYQRLSIEQPDDFANWERLVQACERQDGGLVRTSSVASVERMRDVYDRFLARFPLLFGYWKKYADFEAMVSGSENADMVYARGVASIPYSTDLWTHYLAFKSTSSHDEDVLRSLFEQGAEKIGLDFYSHMFWDLYIEFEERAEQWDRVYAILERLTHIPMHQYARYYEKFTKYAEMRDPETLASPDVIAQFRDEILREPVQTVQAGDKEIKLERGDLEVKRELRERVNAMHLEIYSMTQIATTKRWTYESEIKRPYFLAAELDAGQIQNWHKYLDFEELEGDFDRIMYLYEKALIPCALYDHMWLRYIRWLDAQQGMQDAVRLVFQRACSVFVPIARPGIRVQYAYWEERLGDVPMARAILAAVLEKVPFSLEVIMAQVHLERRTSGVQGARKTIQNYLADGSLDVYLRGKLVTENIRLTWKCEGDIEAARAQFEQCASSCLESRYFWVNYLNFEIETAPLDKDRGYAKVSAVMRRIESDARISLSTLRDLAHKYQIYLVEQADAPGLMEEYFEIDREVDGPFSVQTFRKAQLDPERNPLGTTRAQMLYNGHPGIPVVPNEIANGTNPYRALYEMQGQVPEA